MSLVLDPSQEKAVELVLSARIGVVTGGPGTGKTTILRAALDRVDAKHAAAAPSDEEIDRAIAIQIERFSVPAAKFASVGDDLGPQLEGIAFEDFAFEDFESYEEPLSPYELASPTGKAARRMTEATGRHAQTIHRLLEFSWEGFQRTAENPLATELVVVDEASMLDVELARDLFAAIDPRKTRVVFVGDVAQLPSVGPGRVFGDLIDSGQVPVARLTTLHRAAQESWICRNAPRVLAGEMPELERCTDFEWHACETPADAGDRVVELVHGELPARGIVGAQVLVPQNPGPIGTKNLNRALQTWLNPRRPNEKTMRIGDDELRARDRVIQTKNDYRLGVFNGECGVVRAIGDAGVSVDFDGRTLEYDKGAASNLRLAYALTVHKSQGSEFDWAVVVAHSTNTYMLTRQLLYTAITRAKKGVVLVGDLKGLKVALEKVDAAKRNTSLAERLRGEL